MGLDKSQRIIGDRMKFLIIVKSAHILIIRKGCNLQPFFVGKLYKKNLRSNIKCDKISSIQNVCSAMALRDELF